jgi:hypothetical protein|tara:strand:- start:3031 stop:3294 length:264 start_codon:yes stop_codon:yes gene_type:complete
MANIDPEEIGVFQMPEDLLDKLYEFTGNGHDSSKGFLLAYSDQNGSPLILCKAGSQIIEMGIRKSLEQYLIGLENVDSPFDVNGDQE